MPEDDLLTLEEAWRYLGVSRATLFNAMKRVQIPRYRKPLEARRVYFKRSDLDRLKEPILEDRGKVEAAA